MITVQKGGINEWEGYSKGEMVDDPDLGLLVVEHPSRRLIREDGRSFGIPGESGWLFTAHCRLATEQEQAAFEKRQAIMQQRTAARERLEALTKGVAVQGRQVEQSDVQGATTKVEVKADAYWNQYFLLGTPETAIWYVEYQGASPTIWRIPYTQEAADELLQLQRQRSA